MRSRIRRERRCTEEEEDNFGRDDESLDLTSEEETTSMMKGPTEHEALSAQFVTQFCEMMATAEYSILSEQQEHGGRFHV